MGGHLERLTAIYGEVPYVLSSFEFSMSIFMSIKDTSSKFL